MKQSETLYQTLSENIPLLPLKDLKKFTSSQWDSAVKKIPELFKLRLAIESEKRERQEKQRNFFNHYK